MNQMTTLRWTLEEDVLQYKLAGFDAIGLWLPKVLEYGEERSQAWLEENGLAVSTLSYIGGFTGAFGHELVDVLDEARQVIQLAGRLNAASVICVSGPINNHITKHATRLVVDALSELADEAAQQKVTLSLLPMRKAFCREWTFLNSLDEALTVLDRVDHPAVRLAFDVYHLWPEKDLLSRIPKLLPRIGVVQVSDAPANARGDFNRLLPGDGILPIGEVLSGLVEAGYRGYVDYQICSDTLWENMNLDWLQMARENFHRYCPVAH
jgi:sugar phosphate isomerase/epimerase